MKRIIALVLMLSLILLCACVTREEVSHEVIDYQHTPAHSEVVTDYDYRYNVLSGGWQLVPNTHSVFYDDKYELKYHVTYDDDSTGDVWKKVTEQEYKNAVNELNGGE